MIDDVSYFIQDGRLYAYKEFSIDSIYNDYEFYSDFDFLFYITGWKNIVFDYIFSF